MASITHPEFDRNTYAVDVAAAFADTIKDRVILITGVNKAGIGFTTAQAFASQSPRCLILAGRSKEKVEQCIHSLRNEYPDVDIRLLIVDLSSQKSVRAAATEVLAWKDVPVIHSVINNAGVMRHGEAHDGPVPTNEDGIEEMFGTNHIGHFLLTNLIMPKSIAGGKDGPKGSSRVVNISSSGTWTCAFRASDLSWQKATSDLPEKDRPKIAIMKQSGMHVDDSLGYIPTAAYGHSKTCNILFSVGLNQKLFDKHGILSIALNPGEIKTELTGKTDNEWLDRMIKKREAAGMMHWKTQGQGASTTLVAACDPKLSSSGSSGVHFLSDCQIGSGPPFGAPPWAVDADAAKELWSASEKLTNETFNF